MHGGVRTRPNIKNKTRQGKKCTSLLLQVQGSHKTKSEGHDSVKTGSVVKYSYKSSKSRLEVHSRATVNARRSQGEVIRAQ